MTPVAIRRWSFVHTWSSLVCTVFMLMLCITGLPLVFHDELHALSDDAWSPRHPDGDLLPLDRVLAFALARRPGDVPIFMSFDDDRPVVNVTTGPTADAPGQAMHFASFDRTSGEALPSHAKGVLDFLLQLHTDMFLGLPGMLFLGAMGMLFATSMVSGVVLYAPFTKRLAFGTLRAGRGKRVQWLDWHNLLGIAPAAWLVVVALTGVVNALSTPIIDLWKHTELADLSASAAHDAPVLAQLASLDLAVERARRAAPGMELQFVAFPGGQYSTAAHYAVFMRGETSLTQHLITPAIVDARTGEFVGLRPMPWYVKVLGLSGPLHFGDYGGLPMKVFWGLLDVVAIGVLGSGLLLWWRRTRPQTGGESSAVYQRSTS